MSVAVGLLLSWSVALAAVGGVAVARSRARRAHARRERTGPATGTTALLVVRPCCGAEPELERTLGSALTLAATGASLAVVHAVGSEDDAATSAAATAAARLRDCGLDATLLVTRAVGPNHKAAQLARAVAAAPGPWSVLVCADSDVLLGPDSLAALLAPFADPAVGAVWAPPHEAAAPITRGDRASAAVLGRSLHAFALLAALDRDGLVGKLLAVRREALADAGGFAALTTVLGEDVELGRRLRARGWRVARSSHGARSLARGRPFAAVVARYARWMQVVRGQRPWLLPSYPLLFFATPVLVSAGLLLAAVALAAGQAGSACGAMAAVASAVAARLVVAAEAGAATEARAAGPWRLVTDALLADVTLALAFARASTTRALVWRGRPLAVRPGGRLEECT